MSDPHPNVTIPDSFTAKKRRILAGLSLSEDVYSDRSPKGTVDVQIRSLIDEINAYEGFVTTSSCAGRVAVFVEGTRAAAAATANEQVSPPDPASSKPDTATLHDNGRDGREQDRAQPHAALTLPLASAGGKGGGRWLYVSHDPLPSQLWSTRPRTDSELDVIDTSETEGRPQTLSQLFQLAGGDSRPWTPPPPGTAPRLVRLSFSPLILHVHCATLHHARPLLSAAINAGFRESGAHSLRALTDSDHGVTVAIRTAGLAFETVVGVVVADPVASGPARGDVVRRIVSDDYLALCAALIDDRFHGNANRRERLRTELKKAMVNGDALIKATPGSPHDCRPTTVESKEERRIRKQREGREKQRQHADAGRPSTRVTPEEGPSLHEGFATLGLD